MTDVEVDPTSSSDDANDSDGWDEMEVSGDQTTCLFCSLQFHTIAVALDHCRTVHNFDLLELKTKYNMDCYSFIKMINYIRLHKPSPKILTESSCALWDDDVYLKPGEMESWLMYDFDDLGSTPSTPHFAQEQITVISDTINNLRRQVYELSVQFKQNDGLLHNAMQDMEKMRGVTKSIVESGDEVIPLTDVASIPSHYDSEYFNTYSHYGIHLDMLSDIVRTTSYRDAIMKNQEIFKDKIVLDVGCGTAILSMFAAKAGASKVYGIDQSDVIFKAMEIVRENNLEEQIHLIHSRIENTALPVEKVDIIVSEWMGYFLLFEGMLDSFIYARNTFLTPGGILLPNRCTISLLGISDLDNYNKRITFWDEVYGFSMKCMREEVIKEPLIEIVPENAVITTHSTLKDINLTTCTIKTVNFKSSFKLEVITSGTLTALASYFDIFFELDNPIVFSTGPFSTKTHWQQTIFFLKTPIEVNKGDIIEGTLRCERTKNNVRGLKVTITIGQTEEKYYLG